MKQVGEKISLLPLEDKTELLEHVRKMYEEKASYQPQ
jgi:hypothetical protein